MLVMRLFGGLVNFGVGLVVVMKNAKGNGIEMDELKDFSKKNITEMGQL